MDFCIKSGNDTISELLGYVQRIGILSPVVYVHFGYLQCSLLLRYDKFMLELKIDTDQPNGIFENNQQVQVFVLIHNHSEKSISGQLIWQLKTDSSNHLAENIANINLQPGKHRNDYNIEPDLLDVGFHQVEVLFQFDQGKVVSDQMTIGYQPSSLQTILTRESDFDKFWTNTESKLQQISPAYKLEHQPSLDNEKFTVHSVEMRSLDNLKVGGWLEIPRTSGKHPALLRVPGYGQNMTPLNPPFDCVTFSFNPRGHGNSDDTLDDDLGYWVRGLDQPNSYFYRGAYMDVLRAMDYLASLPEVDVGQTAVWGGSQGGGFSLVVAAFRTKTRYCIADVPFLCDWRKYFQLTQWDEIDQWLAQQPEKRNWTKLMKTLSYFDTINLASRIRAEVLMSVGLQDPVCPPATCFSSYNHIKSEKSYRVYKTAGHRLDQSHYQFVLNWLKSRFGLSRN